MDQVDQIVTDRLASYGAALKALNAIDKRQVGRWLNNRAENSLCGPSVHTSHSDDGNERCLGSGRCEVCRNSPRFTARSTTNSLRGPSGQPGTHPHQPTDFQGSPHRRSLRVAPALRSLIHAGVWRFPETVLICLTAPPFQSLIGH